MENITIREANVTPVVKKGVIVYSGEPYYYIEEVIIGSSVMILAYNLDPKSIKLYRVSHDYNDLNKANKYIQKEHRTVSITSTPLAKYVRKKLGKKDKTTTRKFVYQLPLFVTNLSLGSDTLTGKFGAGFKEKVSSQYVGTLIKNGKQTQQVFPKMQDTGVFIGAEHIKWLDTAVTPNGLLEMMKDIYNVYSDNMSFVSPYLQGKASYKEKSPIPVDPKDYQRDTESNE